ncbi:MAG: hypothetical protein Q4A55_06585 [Aerococcus sp.]|nr:hypothetical protein [Aerococcus sp.]
MATYFVQPVVTQIGTEKTTEALNKGKALTFTRIAFGTGHHRENLKQVTALEHEALSVDARQSSDQTHRQTIKIVGKLDNAKVDQELKINEMGVFARTEVSDEFLFMYTSAEQGDTIPPASEASLVRDYEFNTHISNDGQLQITYSTPKDGYVLEEDYLKFKQEATTTAQELEQKIALNYEDFQELFLDSQKHRENTSNPHNVTAEQVGLGSVKNYPVATTQEALDKSIDNRYMTPKSTQAALEKIELTPGPQGKPGTSVTIQSTSKLGNGDTEIHFSDGTKVTIPKGDQGPTGPQGATGPRGAQGEKGADGRQGVDGKPGPAGPKGDPGEKGADGKSLTVTSSSINSTGDLDVHLSDGSKFIVPKGPQGATGPRGSQGPQGATGPRGYQGNTGPKGDKGDDGNTIINIRNDSKLKYWTGPAYALPSYRDANTIYDVQEP